MAKRDRKMAPDKALSPPGRGLGEGGSSAEPSSPRSPLTLPSPGGGEGCGAATARGEPSLFSGPRYARLTVGILGGSFNPAHDGHRRISLYALKTLGLDRVWWLVSPQNPLKDRAGMAPLAQRLAEARRVAAHPRVEVTAIETALGTQFTADTLTALTRRFPKTRFVWLMGADNLRQIPRWRAWTRIFALAPVAVFARPTYCLNALSGQAAQRYMRRRVSVSGVKGLARHKRPAWAFLRNPLDTTSATAIRQARATRIAHPS